MVQIWHFHWSFSEWRRSKHGSERVIGKFRSIQGARNSPAVRTGNTKAPQWSLRALIVQELCESRGGRPGLSVLTSLLVSVDVKIYWTVLRHWSQLVPNMSTDIWGHYWSINSSSSSKSPPQNVEAGRYTEAQRVIRSTSCHQAENRVFGREPSLRNNVTWCR